jgi:hypothetical protein
MAASKKTKGRPQTPAPLAPEAEARLAHQVAAVAAALEAGADLDELRTHITPDPADPQWDARLLASLGALSHPAVPALLVALFGEARDKTRRKALKRILHHFKTRGVAVAEDLLPREEATVGAPRPATVVAHVTPIFGQGESYIILEGPPEILGGNFLVSLINDREGFRDCMLLNLKRKQQAEFWEHLREQGLQDLLSPPPAHAVAMLDAAYTANPDSPGASQYGALREKIFQHWGRPEETDLVAALPALETVEQPRLAEESRRLAADPLFHSWLPGPEEISPWLDKLKEAQESPLVLSDQQKQVRIDAVLDEAAKALYPPETLPDWSRRLLTTAYYLHLLGREEDSRVARAAAADLADPERSSLSGASPFLKGLVQFAVRLAWEATKPQEPSTPSGLVAPPDSSLLIRR